MPISRYSRLSRVIATALLAAALASCSMPSPPEPPMVVQREPGLQEDRVVMNDGFELPLHRWQAEGDTRAVVLALHGFNDYHKAFADVGPYLAERGITTYAYDQRGFGATANRGDWAGTARMTQDARDILELLREAHPEVPVYLMGESMGGAVSLAAVTADSESIVDGVVLVAPAVWARKTMPWYQRWALAVAEVVAPEWKPSGRGIKRHPSDNIEMLRAYSRDPLVIKQTRIDAVAGLADLMDVALASVPKLNVPALVLYGENDDIVPKNPTCRMLQNLPQHTDWRLGLYPKGYHMLTRDLNGDLVKQDIAGWILQPNAPLASGLQADQARWGESVCQQA